MPRITRLYLPLAFLLFSAMHCNTMPLISPHFWKIEVSPNPISLTEGKAICYLHINTGRHRALKKVDSAIVELNQERNGEYLLVGKRKVIPSSSEFGTYYLSDTARFELSNILLSDSSELFYKITLFKNHRSRETHYVPVAYFINEE